MAIDKPNRKLYEVYQADVYGSVLKSSGYSGISVWPFDKIWGDDLRGDVCSSADASGLSIASMLFSAQEISDGAINHAIRFILPNDRIANKTYVRPSTHTTGGSSGWAPAPTTDLTEAVDITKAALEPGLPYGTRLRLKASTDISKFSSGAQVVARALKDYGMILADGGNVLITAQSDTYSKVKYADVGFDSHSLSALKVTDFEVVPPPQATIHVTNPSFKPSILGNMITVKYLDCYPNF